jgi:hypothetical protein
MRRRIKGVIGQVVTANFLSKQDDAVQSASDKAKISCRISSGSTASVGNCPITPLVVVSFKQAWCKQILGEKCFEV